MIAGTLTKRIDIESCTITTNDYGHIKPEYSKSYSTRASVSYNNGSRSFDSGEIVFTTNVTFTVRKYVPIELTSRIKYNDNYYRVLSIEVSDELNNKTVITELIND